MKKNVIICGCGNMGLRHAQGLSKSRYKINLILIDKSKKKINSLKKKLNFNNTFKVCQEFNTVKKIKKKIDLLILSTDSKSRYLLLKKILKLNNVSFIILEKFVFLQEKHFKEILKLKKKIWVNTPMRIYESYQNLKRKINDKKINMEVKGSRWNMASNIIHYLDLFQFLTNSKKLYPNLINLDKKIYKSKREGYYEISGNLNFLNENKNFISFYDNRIKDNKVKIRIFNHNQNYLIDEKKQICFEKNEKLKFKIPFQSNLTNKIADKIFNSRKCNLTPFNESSYLHILIISLLKKTFDSKIKKEIFPIT